MHINAYSFFVSVFFKENISIILLFQAQLLVWMQVPPHRFFTLHLNVQMECPIRGTEYHINPQVLERAKEQNTSV